jgi:hypothetical protein
MKTLLTLSCLVLATSGLGCKKGEKAGGPPCERLAAALCEGGDVAPCKAFIAKENEGKSQEETDKWCASIVDDPAAVKVLKDDAQKGAAGASGGGEAPEAGGEAGGGAGGEGGEAGGAAAGGEGGEAGGGEGGEAGGDTAGGEGEGGE